MDEHYRSHFIHAIAGLNPVTNRWVPIAHVSWDWDGTRQSHVLHGPLDRFRNQMEAQGYAVAMAGLARIKGDIPG